MFGDSLEDPEVLRAQLDWKKIVAPPAVGRMKPKPSFRL
jgi:hypothetical protein